METKQSCTLFNKQMKVNLIELNPCTVNSSRVTHDLTLQLPKKIIMQFPRVISKHNFLNWR